MKCFFYCSSSFLSKTTNLNFTIKVSVEIFLCGTLFRKHIAKSFPCICTLIGQNWQKVWVVLAFLDSQTHFSPKLRTVFPLTRSHYFFIFRNLLKTLSGFTLLRRRDKSFMFKKESKGGDDIWGKFLNTRFKTHFSFSFLQKLFGKHCHWVKNVPMLAGHLITILELMPIFISQYFKF